MALEHTHTTDEGAPNSSASDVARAKRATARAQAGRALLAKIPAAFSYHCPSGSKSYPPWRWTRIGVGAVEAVPSPAGLALPFDALTIALFIFRNARHGECIATFATLAAAVAYVDDGNNLARLLAPVQTPAGAVFVTSWYAASNA